MSGDECKVVILDNVIIQENGIIRNSKGNIIARLVDDVLFEDACIQSEAIKKPLEFEIGKCYRHNAGTMISIIGELETTMYGKALIAETTYERAKFIAVGNDEHAAMNYTEITRDEWLANFFN